MYRIFRRDFPAALAAGGFLALAIACAIPWANAQSPAVVRIGAIERRGAELIIRVPSPQGVARIVLEGCRRGDLKGWLPLGVSRVAAGAAEAVFTVPVEADMELFRVRADSTDPLPPSFYAGI